MFQSASFCDVASATIIVALAIVSPAGAVESRSPSPVLVHDEEFASASEYDQEFWIAETGFFRNREAQYYRADNVRVADGLLVLEGRREGALNAAYDPNGDSWLTTTREAQYTSGSLVSREPFLYGIFEVVARLPQGLGAWPAVWMVNEHELPYREIDLVEAVGVAPGRAWSSVAAGPRLGELKLWRAETQVRGLDTDFHTYRLEWRKNSLAMSIDGKEVLHMDPQEAHRDGIDPLRA